MSMVVGGFIATLSIKIHEATIETILTFESGFPFWFSILPKRDLSLEKSDEKSNMTFNNLIIILEN